MSEAMDMLKQGYIVFLKNGEMQTAEPPEYGSVEITYQDGQPVVIDYRAKKKLTKVD